MGQGGGSGTQQSRSAVVRSGTRIAGKGAGQTEVWYRSRKAVSEAFRGEFYQRVDGKARVSIPAAFRRVLEAGDPPTTENPRPRIVMVYGDERRQFLECYTVAEMKRVEDRIRAIPIGTPRRRILERNLITLSLTVEIDDDGRIVLPQKARDKIALGADEMKAGIEATFAGALDTFQIWKADVYGAAIVAQAEAELDQLPDDVDLLSLLNDASEGV